MSELVLLTVKEVAEMLGLSERTVYRLADSGAIRTYPGEVDTYLRTCRSGAKSAELSCRPS